MKKLCLFLLLFFIPVVSMAAPVTNRSIGGILDVLEGGTVGQYLIGNGNGDAPTWATVIFGSGDVIGPASAIANNFASFNGATGKLIKDSGSKASDFATALGADDNYVTDAEKIVIGNTSGINTGDQIIPTSVDSLGPSQSGNGGKYLTTNGTNAFWDVVADDTAVYTEVTTIDELETALDTASGAPFAAQVPWIMVAADITIDEALTVNAGTRFSFVPGSVITVPVGTSITFDRGEQIVGIIDNKIFNIDSGTITFTNGGAGYVEWFGGFGNNLVDCTDPFADFIASGLNELNLLTGTYLADDININVKNFILTGQGKEKTIIKDNNSSPGEDSFLCIYSGTGENKLRDIVVRDICIDGDASGATDGVINRDTVEVRRSYYNAVHFYNVRITNSAASGLKVWDSCFDHVYDSVVIEYCVHDYGLKLDWSGSGYRSNQHVFTKLELHYTNGGIYLNRANSNIIKGTYSPLCGATNPMVYEYAGISNEIDFYCEMYAPYDVALYSCPVAYIGAPDNLVVIDQCVASKYKFSPMATNITMDSMIKISHSLGIVIHDSVFTTIADGGAYDNVELPAFIEIDTGSTGISIVNNTFRNYSGYATKGIWFNAIGNQVNYYIAGNSFFTGIAMTDRVVYGSGAYSGSFIDVDGVHTDGDILLNDQGKISGIKAVARLSTEKNGNDIAAGDTITFDTKTYTFKATLTPTEGEILIGANDASALDNLKSAINHEGSPGTDYSCAAAHPTVLAALNSNTYQVFQSRLAGGTSIATTETGANISFRSGYMDASSSLEIHDYSGIPSIYADTEMLVIAKDDHNCVLSFYDESDQSWLFGYDKSDGNLKICDASLTNFGTNVRLLFDSNKNMGLGSTISAGGGAKVFYIEDATTNPSTNPTNGVILYSTGGELTVRDTSGNVTTLSPHANKYPSGLVTSDFPRVQVDSNDNNGTRYIAWGKVAELVQELARRDGLLTENESVVIIE